ncbi:MAG TPA: peptidylprolyl isomerase [Chitinophagales bacterium]|nr:peptidylprolyl isomerase [Chitinophagales bacterium]HPA35601.1 peptidylprolyl isomerase [Chitinophagales bacterium]HQO89210.1 peptidylprolyl isomerase [Chitinophagales bacterium]
MRKLNLLFFVFFGIQMSFANGILLDKIDAIVNDKIILRSDIENQLDLLNLRGEGEEISRCELMEQLVYNKILTTQALRDSLPLGSDEVEEELTRKINYFISVAGSQEAFEEYYKKTVSQIKDDYRDDIREQMLAARMRSKILEDIQVTPSEVKAFFDKLSRDSLPYFDATMELQQIVMKPRVSDFQQKAAREKAEGILARIKSGESFELLASLYSEDLASAQDGGLLDWAPRGTYVKDFEAAAFKLKANEVSELVQTPFGYHIIQMIERRGDMIQVRHILIRPQSTSKDAEYAQNKLDSIRNDILEGKITFFSAVKEFSQDDQSKNVGGYVLNYETGGTILEVNKMDPTLYTLVDTMSVGAITPPTMYQADDGSIAFRIVKLVAKVDAHVADIRVDYDKIQNAARNDKETEILDRWFGKNIKKTYLMIADDYKECESLRPIIVQNQ